MSKFAPEITDLLIRAEIYSDPLQLDFFCDRIHPKLQEAVYMRGASNLQEAIKLCTEVEYNLARSGLTLQPYSSVPTGTMYNSPKTDFPTNSTNNPIQNQNAQYY
ncbi:hypothetical protein INT45_002750 [Circinella minor]|uniref:Uncharacterized protein n=1 Tax=Circinella minor TaxID=1195481 RepID=A0A8H7S4R0_9FUNG|nr:hypothetical protein INT45_002750 [Circinella minor]